MNIKWLIYIFFLMTILMVGCGDDPVDPVPETSTMMDIDSNIYRTVKIGGKWWMAEDLRTTHYKDGTPISLVNDINNTSVWNTSGACCVYDNKVDVPGLLYNFMAVEHSSQVAPEGWHIPSDAEWRELEVALGMSSSEAGKPGWRGDDEGDALKKEGLKYWVRFGDVWPTNESGFSALAGGCRMFNNRWSDPSGLQYMGFWWSQTKDGNGNAWYRHLDYKKSGIFRSSGNPAYGFSIRCVKDN